jgi:predicted permease
LAVAEALVPVFLLIGLGFGLKRVGFPGEAFWPALDKLAYFILLPALLVATLAGAKLGGYNPLPLAATLACATLAMAALMLGLRPILPADGPAFTSMFQGALRFNSYVGIAAAFLLFGPPGAALMAVAIAVQVPLLNTLSVLILIRYAGGPATGVGRQVKALAQNPFILACLIGIAMNLTGIGLPRGIGPTIEALGRASVALGLMAAGAALDLKATRAAWGQIGIASGMKLIGFPFVMAGSAWAFGIEGLALKVAILWAAMPTPPSAYVLARLMGGNAPLAAALVTASTIGAVLTVAPMLVLLGGP